MTRTGVTTMLTAAMYLPLAEVLHADDFAALCDQVRALGKLTSAPAMADAEGVPPESGMKAVFYDALPWKGNPTKVFAWLGLPREHQGRVPGIVLVHGGGGTAFKEWVQRWNARGFAAISIAVEGQLDRKAPKGPETTDTGWLRHEWAGPQRQGIYHDSAERLQDQWMYHAVADTVLANSLLRALPDVDAGKVGVMGISWGGVITSTVMGIDTRFAFAIPTYGCGNLTHAANQYGRSLGRNVLYKHVWDPMVHLRRAAMPALWFSWPEDKHFPMDSLAACYHAAPGPRMVTLIPHMGHGHGPPWNRPDSYAFADSVVTSGKPWCRQTQVGSTDATAHAVFASTKPLNRAVLVSTTDTGFSGNRKWVETAADLKHEGGQWEAAAQLPAGTTAWFLNVHSSELTMSSDYQVAATSTSTATHQ